MKSIKEVIKVMLEFDAGREIQVKKRKGSWRRVTVPVWNWDDNDYRLKPKPETQNEAIQRIVAENHKSGRSLTYANTPFLMNKAIEWYKENNHENK